MSNINIRTHNVTVKSQIKLLRQNMQRGNRKYSCYTMRQSNVKYISKHETCGWEQNVKGNMTHYHEDYHKTVAVNSNHNDLCNNGLQKNSCSTTSPCSHEPVNAPPPPPTQKQWGGRGSIVAAPSLSYTVSILGFIFTTVYLKRKQGATIIFGNPRTHNKCHIGFLK